jgi:NAD+ synthase (glutamine-hydrolysing)
MRHGFIKAAAGTPSIRVGDCAHNAQRIRALFARARDQGVRVLVLPELCVTGYTCGDLFLHDALLNEAEQAALSLAQATRGFDMLCAFGAPLRFGGKLYNCAVVCHEGSILGVVPKTYLPNYGEFYELRQFAPAPIGMGEISVGTQNAPFGTRQMFRCASFPALCVALKSARISGYRSRPRARSRRKAQRSSSTCPRATRPSARRITAGFWCRARAAGSAAPTSTGTRGAERARRI